MIVVADMQQGGCFEASCKRKLIDQMAQHYAQNNCEAGQIKAIFVVTKDDKTNEICQNAVARVQTMVEEAVAEWQKVSWQQSQENQDLESDYWAGVL